MAGTEAILVAAVRNASNKFLFAQVTIIPITSAGVVAAAGNSDRGVF